VTEDRRVGPYVLRRLLGAGGFGHVYVVHKVNPTGDPLVGAMKLPHAHMVGNPSVTARVLREARLGMRLGSHPNIVMVTDVGVEGSMPYVVMEYLDCIDLGHLLKRIRHRKRPLPVPAVFHILASICTGLYHAHSGATIDGVPVRIVHRDITPHNILVTRDGAVKIADFGLGVSLSEGSSQRAIRGTYRYMSPEHIDSVVRPEMDVYGFGVVAWELIEGRVYREGVQGIAHFPLIMNGSIPEMHNQHSQLKELIRACLDVSPSARPTAAELCDLLPRCESYSRDPAVLVQDIMDIIGDRRSSGASQEHFSAPTQLIATLAAVKHEQRNDRSAPPQIMEQGEPTENVPLVALARDPDAPRVFRKREGSPGDEQDAGPIQEFSVHMHRAAHPLPVVPTLVAESKPFEDRTTEELGPCSVDISTQELAAPPPVSSRSDRSAR